MRIAREKWLFVPQFYNLGNYSLQAQHRVDDKPYGGGAGALIQIEPVYNAIMYLEGKMQSAKCKVQNEGLLKNSDIAPLSRGVAWNAGGFNESKNPPIEVWIIPPWQGGFGPSFT